MDIYARSRDPTHRTAVTGDDEVPLRSVYDTLEVPPSAPGIELTTSAHSFTMTNSNHQSVVLSNLLPSPSYMLSYSLPLLLISIILTFAGAFLTLDRTRSFPPRYDVIPGAFDTKKVKKLHWSLQGGVGGLAIGYAFGGACYAICRLRLTDKNDLVHLSTFVALLIPSVSSSSSLGPKSFLAVWLLSAIVTTFLAGRWQYAALAFSGISGGYAITSFMLSGLVY